MLKFFVKRIEGGKERLTSNGQNIMKYCGFVVPVFLGLTVFPFLCLKTALLLKHTNQSPDLS